MEKIVITAVILRLDIDWICSLNKKYLEFFYLLKMKKNKETKL